MGSIKSVLLVDDNVSLCRSMAFILRRKGYEVALAMDGQEAIAMVSDKAFDMIFMDIKMPLMDGAEAHRRIREISPETVVMMMTAYADEHLIQQALVDGAYGIIHKPLDIEKILGVLQVAKDPRKGMLVLVVEDNPGEGETLKKILTRKSNQVAVAGTGEEAIAMARKKRWDVVLVDLKLPTISGFDTYEAIRRINPDAVAVMMTAHRQEMKGPVEQGLAGKVYTCLYKPLDMEKLLSLISEIGGRRAVA